MSSAPATILPPAEAEKSPRLELFVSEQEYWDKYYEAETAYEWNNGVLEEKPVSDYETGEIYRWFLGLLEHYRSLHPQVKITVLDMGFRLVLPSKVTIRKPDLGVVSAANPVPLHALERSFRGVFDLCVEALSDSKPSAITHDTVTKKKEYAARGVREYYILHHDSAYRAFYALNTRGQYDPLTMPDGVVHSGVLPGFQFRAADLQRRPEPENMMQDPVYREFVLPAWQAEIRAREEAEKRAEAEAFRAEAEARRAASEAEARHAAEAEVARLQTLLSKSK